MRPRAESLVAAALGLTGVRGAGAYLVSGNDVRRIAARGLPPETDAVLSAWLAARDGTPSTGTPSTVAFAETDPTDPTGPASGRSTVRPEGHPATLPADLHVQEARADGETVGLVVAALPGSDPPRPGSDPPRSDGELPRPGDRVPPPVTDALTGLSVLLAGICTGGRDPLTGLVGRDTLLDHLSLALSAAPRSHTQPALLFCDVDGLKWVNDRHGHGVGDAVLRQAAERLVEAVRPQDTVARHGGDEFVVLCPSLTTLDEAVVIATRLRDALAVDFLVDGFTIRAPGSIGVAMGPFPDASAGLRQADAAMYKAKRARTGYAVYDASLHRDDRWHRSVRADFPIALVDGQLRLHYQPQYRLSSGRIVTVEALLRWEHPSRGLLTPEAFLHSLQVGRTGAGLCAWVLRQACEAARGWMPRTPRANAPAVAVNLFPQDLTGGDLPDLVMKVLRDTGLPGRRLQLEVAETALLADPVDAAGQLRLIGDLGVTVALDDFGAGFSSLALLRDLPVHTLKIDRSFTRDLPVNPRSSAIVAAMVRLGHRLHARICAEGLETTEQLRLLRGLGCDDVQGDLLHPPVPADDLPGLPWQPTAGPDPTRTPT